MNAGRSPMTTADRPATIKRNILVIDGLPLSQTNISRRMCYIYALFEYINTLPLCLGHTSDTISGCNRWHTQIKLIQIYCHNQVRHSPPES